MDQDTVASAASSTRYIGEEVASREPHVLRELGGMDDQIERLNSVIDDLQRRLGPVLRAEPPSEALRTGGDEESLAPYAERIRTQRRLVDGNVDRLRELLDRLEV